MAISRKTGSVALLATLACIALIQPAAGTVQIGDTAPSFYLYDTSGSAYQLADQLGTVVLLYFFGTNAPVCMTSAPAIERQFYRSAQYQGLLILGIDCWNRPSGEVTRMQSDAGVSFPFLLDGKDAAGSYGLPYNSFVVVNGAGKVAYVSSGPDESALDAAALGAAITQAMNDANSDRDATWGAIKSLYTKDKSRRK